MSRIVRFGVLGTGVFADLAHIPGLAAHPEVELVGVWGRDPAKAVVLAERHGIAAEADLDALLEQVDAVAIVVTPEAQPELAVRAAQAGCHLLLEKPLALSHANAQRVVDAAQAARVASIVNFSFRFMEPGATWLRDSVPTQTWAGGVATLVAPVLAPDGPFSKQEWTSERVLWESVCHPLAILMSALGPVVEVVAVSGPETTVHLALRHAGGAVSSTTVTLTTRNEAFHFDYAFWGPERFCQPPAPDGAPQVSPYDYAVSALVDSIRTGVPHLCDARFGAENVRVLEAAERFLARPSGAGGELCTPSVS